MAMFDIHLKKNQNKTKTKKICPLGHLQGRSFVPRLLRLSESVSHLSGGVT